MLLILGTLNYANAQQAKQNIQFIYINGSNSNDERAKDAYVKGFNDLHRQMKSILESDEFISKKLFNDGKYTVNENDIFFLTVNFADDPVGFPVVRNISKTDIEMEYNITLSDNSKGFVYNYSKARSGGMFATAHFGYWKHAKRFAKTVRDAYEKGYSNYYEIFD